MNLITLFLVFLAVYVLAITWYTKFRRPPYPPGPKPLPILGNLKDLPRDKEALRYTQWAREYGDIYHLSVLGTRIVVVNSPATVNDLFVDRSWNYSDRPRLTMIKELMGWDFAFGMMPFGDRWKKHRRMFSNHFRPSNMPTYHHVQRACVHDFLRDLLQSPEDLENHIRHLTTNSIFRAMYGVPIAKKDDHFGTVAEKAFEAMVHAASPGEFLVDTFPILKYVPAWFPGAGFQRKAQEWRKLTHEMVHGPFNASQVAMRDGTASNCFVVDVTRQLRDSESGAEEFETLRNCAGLGLAAGVQTTSASISTFFLAMMLYPDVQKRAQKELDCVCAGRLPDFSDRHMLPYIDALCAEIFRWGVVSPLGSAHMVTQDDVYKGYFIPAGTLVFGNSWAIAHDETTYPESFELKPERFLSHDEKKCTVSVASVEAFGYGRRNCPGRFLADAQLFIMIASVLKVFNIGPIPGTSKARPAYEDLFTFRLESHPVPFKCTIVPRDQEAVSLVGNV